jgi:hypothetical protein
VADCADFPEDCNPTIETQVAEGLVYPYVIPYPVTYKLAPPAWMHGSWLKGTSSNYGSDDDTVPDYVFTRNQPGFLPPTDGGLRISTEVVSDPETVYNADGLVVSLNSQDYGGVANLSATVTWFAPNGTFTYPIPVSYPYAPPPCAGTGQFVQIPVDVDCNGIADYWEGQYTNPPGGHLDPRGDADSGAQGAFTPAEYQGDGFSNFDEYRGFHVLDANSNPTWISTNPTQQDLFYWDFNNAVVDAQGVNHLANIFGAQTAGFMALHRVNAEQAQAKDLSDPTQGVKAPLNVNSPFLKSGGPQGFAVIYQNTALGAGTLGQSGPPNDLTNALQNTGVRPIQVDLKQIQSTAKGYMGNWKPFASVLLDQTLAHETGHKLGRMHRMRTASAEQNEQEDVPTLGLGSFMQMPTKPVNLFVTETLYQLTTKAGFLQSQTLAQEHVNCGTTADSSGRSALYNNATFSRTDQNSATPPIWPYPVTILPGNPKQPPPTLNQLFIESQDGTIMAHTPELSQTSDSQWNFAADDLNRLCLLPGGCGVTTHVSPCEQ